MAVGSKQRIYDEYKTSDGSSSTVIAVSIFFTGAIEAHENWAMCTIDVGNTLIQADYNDRILMILHGKCSRYMADPRILHKEMVDPREFASRIEFKSWTSVFRMFVTAEEK